jgi:hypothetical protein
MVILRMQHKIDLASQYRDLSRRGQALRFVLAKVDGKHDRSCIDDRRTQDANAPSLDQADNWARAMRGQYPTFDCESGPVIRHQESPQRQKPQRKR